MYDDPAWANNATRRFAETGKSKFGGLNSARADLLLRLLDRIRSPDEIGPLRSLALHRLKGARNGQWAMTVNGPWRICFHFEDGDAYEVEIVDYH